MTALVAFGLLGAASAAAQSDDAVGPVTTQADDAEPVLIHADTDELQLVILHHNDGESQLVQASSDLPDFGGAARFASLVHQLRDEATADGAAVITISSGDNFLSGPELSVSLDEDGPFYDALALNLIGYDALTIGNHEFDLGPDVLARFITETTTAPFISANLDFSGEPALAALADEGRIAPSVVVEKQGRRIGIIGATTPELTYISSPRNVVVNPNVAGIVQPEIDRLTADGVDIIVLSTHLQALSSEIDLAADLTGVDAIVAGGSGALLADDSTVLLPGDGDPYGPYPLTATLVDGTEVPVVTTPGDYTYVGRLILTVDADGNVTAIDDASGLQRVAGGDEPDAVEPHPDVVAQVTEPVSAALDDLAANPVGTTEVPLDGRRSPGIRTAETNLGNLLTDALLWNGQRLAEDFGVPQPAVAIQNGGGIRNDSVIPVGPLSELETFNISPFGNFVTVIEDVSAAQMKVIFENAVSRVESSSGRFAQVAGMTLVYNPEGTPQEIGDDDTVTVEGTRVWSITLDDGTALVADGAVVDGAPSTTLVTLNFLANGGDQYLFGDGTRTNLGLTDQQSLAAYVSEGLEAVIPADRYPEGGEGRIVTASPEADDDMDDADDGMGDADDGMDDGDTDEEVLAESGSETGVLLLIGASLVLAGLLFLGLSRRTTARRLTTD
ncbi:bifunctional metallophosphatase/5'-nucleotidase [Candidatus Poriferisocius sp.]|uniref:bifunctional metallophosphatase/5'-nucleotidase n=1 Tax=Candidatus Poriferisocius sp. TaxID=3101276 RepID=UPI003B5B8966